MEQAPTPCNCEKPNINEFNFELKKEIVNENKKYIIILKAENDSELNIKAINDSAHTMFANNFKIKEIQENKYFIQFDNLKEVCKELSERIDKEKIIICEDINSLLITVPLPSSKIKEINFKLKKSEENINNKNIDFFRCKIILFMKK